MSGGIGTLSFGTTSVYRSLYGTEVTSSRIDNNKSVATLGKQISFYNVDGGALGMKIGDEKFGHFDATNDKALVSATIPEKAGEKGFMLKKLQAGGFGITYIEARINNIDIKVGTFNHDGTSLELEADVELIKVSSGSDEKSGERISFLAFRVFRISGLLQFGGFKGTFVEIDESGDHTLTIGSSNNLISFIKLGNKTYGATQEPELEDSQVLPTSGKFKIKKLRAMVPSDIKSAALSLIEAVIQDQDLRGGYDKTPDPHDHYFLHEVNIDVQPMVTLKGVRASSSVVHRTFFDFHQVTEDK